MDCLVTTEWLATEMAACDLRIVDASLHLPDSGRHASAEYGAVHIPGAVFMDLANLVDPAALCDNSLPSAEAFATAMQALGLGDGSRIILYDNSAIHSAARAWVMLRLFGAQDVAILDGGLAKWQAEGRPLEAEVHPIRTRHFTTWQNAAKLRKLGDVLANLDSKAEQVVDARSPARFAGSSPEPRPGLAAGHIPGAINVPYATLYRILPARSSPPAAAASPPASSCLAFTSGASMTLRSMMAAGPNGAPMKARPRPGPNPPDGQG